MNPIRLLLVEDNPGDALLLRVGLERAAPFAFELTQVGQISEAEQVLSRGGVDAVLLDLSLPDSRGVETVRRAVQAAPTVPVVVLTGMQDERLALAVVQEGAEDYLCKDELGTALVTRSIRYAIERKRREIEMAALRRQNELILNSVGDGICGIDMAGRITFANPAAGRALGWTAAELVGRSLDDLFPPAPAVEAARNGEGCPLRTAVRDGRVFHADDAVFRRRDGSGFFVEYTSTPIVVDGGITGAVVSFRNIAKRREAEEALQRSEAYYRSLIENAHDLITVIAESGVIQYESPSVERTLGHRPEELIGRSVLEFVHPEDVETVAAVLVEVIGQAGRTHAFELRFRAHDGSWRILEGVAVNLLHDPAVGAIVANSRDVTEMRLDRARLDAYTRELERSNRALQEFAYVASHDLQEPLRKIRTFGDRLKSRFGSALGEQGADYVERMQSAAARMQSLVEDLLTYSRVTTKGRAFQPVDLAQVAAGVLSDLSSRVEQTGAEVRVEALPVIEADPVQMRQLLQNLIANAVKFHRPGVAPVVRVTSAVGPEGVEIQVQDDGIGFDPQHAERIFSPFQRPHGRAEYEGTGMGLAICRKIVERHGGEIDARSAPGEGATFVVRLPANGGRSEPS